MIVRLYRQVYSAFNKKTGLYDLIEMKEDINEDYF
jgi:hypothetical protein